MPFLSKDWRDPGDQWVRYDGGWEKRKTLSVAAAVTATEQLSSSFSPPSTSEAAQQQEVAAASGTKTRHGHRHVLKWVPNF